MEMEILRVLILSVLLLLSTAQLPSQDILALLEFKKGIKYDPSGFLLNSWNEESIDSDGCPSSWNGIFCDGGNVSGIVLNNLGISADIDLGILANLKMLLKISLSNNLFKGRILNNIANFKNLQYLDLSDNLFYGTLPQEIGQLESLQNFSLAGNNISGSIPDSIGKLTSIHSLDLSRNLLSHSLPSSLTKLRTLFSLNLSHNDFTGRIPSGFWTIPSLQVIDFRQNRIEGAIDESSLLLSNAFHVDFSSNMLETSSSPTQKFLVGISDTIKYLNLSHNRFTGTLTGGGSFPLFETLQVLDLSHNQLSGELPGFHFFYDLEVLKLSHNNFSGFIPDGLLRENSMVLAELDLSANNLSGPINMITSTTLRILNLSSNSLSGELPALIGDCSILDLSGNHLSGNLSMILKWGNVVEFVDLSHNLLTGSFPEVTSEFLRLSYLNASHNLLSNSLPTILTRYPKLKTLDLSYNQFNGTLLNDLLISPALQELHLQKNLLLGTISFSPPPSNENILRILDLSSNQFNGTFPEDLLSLTDLQIFNISGNNFTGSLPSSLSQFISLTSLDVSSNNFTGSLPENLPESLKTFNASGNDFSGIVPPSLRKFPESSFHPGNSKLRLPNSIKGSAHGSGDNPALKPIKTIVKAAVIVPCVVATVVLILLSAFVHYKRISRGDAFEDDTKKSSNHPTLSNSITIKGKNSLDDQTTSHKCSSSEIRIPDKILSTANRCSSSKAGQFSWSPDSGDSYVSRNFGRLDDQSPDRLAGELHLLDDLISLTPEELSRAPAEVLGRSSHGTSYRATLDSGLYLTVKWLREGVAKQKKDFDKELKKLGNIKHPNVVSLRGYYWGPTQHEKLLLLDYITPGNLASFLYDRPGRRDPQLSWSDRLKIAVDVARGLNYLHFDRAIPHGNLKATNILLDGSQLNARISDYCLHRLMTHAGTIEQILDAGVLGYRAPELASAKKPTPSFKSDVYAFGVILLELLTGKCAGDVIPGEEGGVDLTDWVRLRAAEGRGSDCFDEVLMKEMDIPASSHGMKEVLGIALRCIRPVYERPGIKLVYEDLSSI